MEKKSLFKVNNNIYVVADGIIEAIQQVNNDPNISESVHSIYYVEEVYIIK